MNKRLPEIFANVLFWLISSWLITSVFSIVRMEVTIIGDKETEIIERDPGLIVFFLVGQVLFAIYFYWLLMAIVNLSAKTDMRIFLGKQIGLAVLLLWSFYALSSWFILKGVAPFPSIVYGIFGFYAAVAIGYGFIKIWIRNEADKQQLEVLKNQAELKILRAQLQPHFLFNTMNNLLAMVDQQANPVLASSIDKLSALLRYVVYDTKNEKVAIADEINFLENFAALHLLRFEENELDYTLSCTGPYDQQAIEPGILLCFVENAFKHGVQPEIKSFIHIQIDVTAKNRILFEIENTIPPELEAEKQGGYGLKSTIEHLELAYPKRHALEMIKAGGLYRVKLEIETNHQ